ncbi:hypothetical protein [Leptospira andrefontaineae]|uniref:Lipoprotein n=1 Tax=Leptospira andrefontaineae TaxID=2484976 RepID=A0A4R9GX44_9LEPT|nr:hypothetical protein [Leptospira andrefontaineae]TGK36267.1 hypothetical protein EHO65_18375 [Leptospira andrefontaineae]
MKKPYAYLISTLSLLFLLALCTSVQPPDFKKEAATSEQYAEDAKKEGKAAEKAGDLEKAKLLYSYEKKFRDQAEKFKQGEAAYNKCESDKASMVGFYEYGKKVFMEKIWFITVSVVTTALLLWAKFGNLGSISAKAISVAGSLFSKDTPPTS